MIYITLDKIWGLFLFLSWHNPNGAQNNGNQNKKKWCCVCTYQRTIIKGKIDQVIDQCMCGCDEKKKKNDKYDSFFSIVSQHINNNHMQIDNYKLDPFYEW